MLNIILMIAYVGSIPPRHHFWHILGHACRSALVFCILYLFIFSELVACAFSKSPFKLESSPNDNVAVYGSKSNEYVSADDFSHLDCLRVSHGSTSKEKGSVHLCLRVPARAYRPKVLSGEQFLTSGRLLRRSTVIASPLLIRTDNLLHKSLTSRYSPDPNWALYFSCYK